MRLVRLAEPQKQKKYNHEESTLTRALTVLLLLAAWSEGVHAAQLSPSQKAASDLQMCFKLNWIDLWVNNKHGSSDMMSERAFAACKAEEDLLRAQLNIYGYDPLAEGVIAAVKLKLKGQARVDFYELENQLRAK